MPLARLRSAPTYEDFPEDVLRAAREAPWVIGTDEVGYGAWAGPLVVVGVLVPGNWAPPPGVTDSKKVKKEAERERLSDAIRADPLVRFLIHETPHDKLDDQGIYATLIRAHQHLHEALRREVPDAFCIADGALPLGNGIYSEPRADGHVPAVSAASLIGKTLRDRMMIEADKLYPGYNFVSNKGYAGKGNIHREALQRLGPCPIHRRSFAPVAEVVAPVDEPCTAWEVPIQEED